MYAIYKKNRVPDKTAIINLTESNDTSDSQVSITIFELYDWLSRVLDSKYLVAMYIVQCTFYLAQLKGVFAKNERGYRLNAIKKRFWSLLILLLSVASIRRKLIKTSHTEERSANTT